MNPKPVNKPNAGDHLVDLLTQERFVITRVTTREVHYQGSAGKGCADLAFLAEDWQIEKGAQHAGA